MRETGCDEGSSHPTPTQRRASGRDLTLAPDVALTGDRAATQVMTRVRNAEGTALLVATR